MRFLVGAIALFGAQGVVARPFTSRADAEPSVDLGYAVYEGTLDVTNGINVFKGSVPLAQYIWST